MPKILTYDFCTLRFYSNYMIAEINEEHLTPNKNQVLIDSAKTHYVNNPFVYITYRKYSYSVDPVVFIKTSKISNLLGIAVVTATPASKSGNTKIEKLFYNKPYEIFSTLDDAIEWAQQILEDD